MTTKAQIGESRLELNLYFLEFVQPEVFRAHNQGDVFC